MNKHTKVIVVGIVLVVIVGGAYASMSNKNSVIMENEKMIEEKDMIEKKDENVIMKDYNIENDSMMKEDKTDMMDKPDSMMKAGTYDTYSADKVAQAGTDDVVIFFHASWCPSCRGLNSNIESNIKSIPEGVSILKADYDKEIELKKKYGVTTQHTLVQVDKDGNLIKKWSGGGSLESVLSQIQ
jgi:thioredoxin 1